MQRPSGNKWPSLRYFVLIAMVIGLVGVLIAFLVIFAKSNYVFRTVADKYDILVDLLVILLASGSLLIAALGYWVYRVLSERIERQAILAARMEGHYWAARTLTNEGLELWNSYKKTKNLSELTKAIELTDRAYYSHAISLDERERNYERLICYIMNNLGYYRATLGLSSDREFARKCAQYLQE